MRPGGKMFALIAAKVACCALLVLALTGAMGGLFAWVLANPAAWAIAAALALGIGLIVWRRRGPASSRPPRQNA